MTPVTLHWDHETRLHLCIHQNFVNRIFHFLWSEYTVVLKHCHILKEDYLKIVLVCPTDLFPVYSVVSATIATNVLIAMNTSLVEPKEQAGFLLHPWQTSWQVLLILCAAQQGLQGDKEFLLGSKSTYIQIDSAYPSNHLQRWCWLNECLQDWQMGPAWVDLFVMFN